jgi:hypothetical protein
VWQVGWHEGRTESRINLRSRDNVRIPHTSAARRILLLL